MIAATLRDTESCALVPYGSQRCLRSPPMRAFSFFRRLTMGRPSKLSDAKWEELKQRLAKGEKAADLAREYNVSKAAISTRVSKRIETIKTVANQIVTAEEALSSLSISEQLLTVSLANDLRAISTHLAGAAKFGAATAHRLNGIAHSKVQEIDDAAPLDAGSLDALKGVAVLTKLANDASQIGVNLLAANKDMIKEANQGKNQDPAVFLREVAALLPN